MRRVFALALLSLLTLPALTVGAQAKTVPFKGRLISTTTAVSQTTGNCMCNANWYTFAVDPGAVTITGTLQGYSLAYGPSYGLRMFLYAGTRPDGGGQAGCMTSQKHCRQQAVIRSTVRKSTVFYLEVYGPGASLVYYSLRVNAKIRRLHCYRVCTGA